MSEYRRKKPYQTTIPVIQGIKGKKTWNLKVAVSGSVKYGNSEAAMSKDVKDSAKLDTNDKLTMYLLILLNFSYKTLIFRMGYKRWRKRVLYVVSLLKNVGRRRLLDFHY